MLFDTLRYYLTLWKWKRCAHHRKRAHVRIGNLPDFFRQLNEAGVHYVVLRWFDCVPLTKEAEKEYVKQDGDMDILADANDLLKICRAVASHPGKVKVDLYSNRLLLGTDIRRYTYYPPVLCRDLLESRVLDEKGVYYRPNDKLYLYSLAYHLVYQKGLASGFPTGFSDLAQQPKESERHDPEGTLRQLAKAVGETLPEEFNLLQLHLWLKKRGWNMPLDLLLRWPRQHELLPRLYKYESDSLRQALGNRQNLCVYLLREDAIKAGATEQILAELRTHYRILDTVTFTPDQQDRVIRRTRGGNWTKRKQLRLFLPEVAVVCQALVPFTPMDDTAAASSEQKENNPDILFKVALRKKMAEQFPDASDFLHGSDNDIESMEYIQAIYGDDAWQAKWVEFFPDK
ncbi:MAG: hypothetical protein IKR81_11090 [Victivallales bacterium]|nr:hypothetical protein [Victivallales bacterium]